MPSSDLQAGAVLQITAHGRVPCRRTHRPTWDVLRDMVTIGFPRVDRIQDLIERRGRTARPEKAAAANEDWGRDRSAKDKCGRPRMFVGTPHL